MKKSDMENRLVVVISYGWLERMGVITKGVEDERSL